MKNQVNIVVGVIVIKIALSFYHWNFFIACELVIDNLILLYVRHN